MKISGRGWARDMGTTIFIEQDLVELNIDQDPHRRVWRGGPGLFASFGRVFLAWRQSLRHIGNYRMEIEFSTDDILRLFKARFGKKLEPWLLDEHGFTVSDDFKERVLSTVKLSDVTLGQLVAMSASPSEKPATADKLVQVSNVTPITRR
jgi:hypothetical protein